MSVDDLMNQANDLPLHERAELAHRLLLSLEKDEAEQEGFHTAWDAELQHRIEQVERGEVTPLPWEEVRARLWSKQSGNS